MKGPVLTIFPLLFFMLWGLTYQEETALPRASQFLGVEKDLPAGMPFICKPINPGPILLNYLLYQTLTQETTAPLLQSLQDQG